MPGADFLAAYNSAELALNDAQSELRDYLTSLIGSHVLIKGYPSESVIASAVSPDGEILRRTKVSTSRRFKLEDPDEVKRPRVSRELDQARIDSVTNSELSVGVVATELHVEQFQTIAYIFRFRDIISLEPVPVLAK